MQRTTRSWSARALGAVLLVGALVGAFSLGGCGGDGNGDGDGDGESAETTAPETSVSLPGGAAAETVVAAPAAESTVPTVPANGDTVTPLLQACEQGVLLACDAVRGVGGLKEEESRRIETCNGEGVVAGDVAERNGTCFRGAERLLLREPEDNTDVDAVLALCRGGNGRACRAIVDVVAAESPLALLALTCGNTATLEGIDCKPAAA